MKIELKNFKHFPSISEETEAFSATIYVEGQRMFLASNRGHGEENRVEPVTGKTYADVRKLADWVKSQPPVKSSFSDEPLDDNLDYFISRLVADELVNRDLSRLLKRHVLLYEPKDGNGLTQLVAKFKPGLIESFRKSLEKSFPDSLILNDMSFDQAMLFYRDSDSPEKLAELYTKFKPKA